VKQYVDDLAVMRENLLKIEFRNIELEEALQESQKEMTLLKEQNSQLEEYAKQFSVYEEQVKHKEIIDLQQ